MATPLLMLSADAPPQLGGVSAYSESIARSLVELGVDLSVEASVPDPSDRPIGGAPTRRGPSVLNRKYVKILPLFAAGLRGCLRFPRPMLLLMKCNHEGVAGYVLHRLFGVRYAVVAFGSELLQFSDRRWTGPFLRRMMRRAECVVAISAYTRDLVVDGLGVDPGRVLIVPPIVEPTPEPTDEGLDAIRDRFELHGKRVLLTVARLVRRKGHDMVLRALADLREDYPDLAYVIVGDGGDREALERQIRALGVGDLVRMVGARSAEEVDALYRVSEIFVMPSRREGCDIEGFGIAFLEANLRRKPVVAGRCGGVADAVVDGETGMLVDPTRWEETAAALRTLLDDPDRGRRMGDSGRDRALRAFGRDRQVECLREVVDRLGLLEEARPVAAGRACEVA
ncbi:glycosyltransferase family 4 protein [Tautonia sociabilis]|uniref:Glycosyltransferase family 1 protein n=1 Tax=Tautonia sociabilis TaxID=2080755 RepID=A0A432MKH7_9BACT|nr:glycosyltransferase family 4 protein [Tautonia sociabilis]RUL87636.1 glycosyltransferase family 1 protein [Tautonia sociabilis]